MFHSVNPSEFGRGDVRSEVKALQSTLSELSTVCDSLLGDAPHAMPLLSQLLADFALQLSVYFDIEERGDYRMMLVDRPGLRMRVTRLEKRHEGLRDSVASMSHLAHGSGSSGMYLRDLRSGIWTIVDEFENQERAERALVQDFFLRDEGSSE